MAWTTEEVSGKIGTCVTDTICRLYGHTSKTAVQITLKAQCQEGKAL